MRALELLIEHDTLGQQARYERFTADLLYILAAGQRIDELRVPRFAKLLDKVFVSPFDKQPEQPETAAEIIQRICDDIHGLLEGITEDEYGSAEPGREDHAG